jgi:hypothetical protein
MTRERKCWWLLHVSGALFILSGAPPRRVSMMVFQNKRDFWAYPTWEEMLLVFIAYFVLFVLILK